MKRRLFATAVAIGTVAALSAGNAVAAAPHEGALGSPGLTVQLFCGCITVEGHAVGNAANTSAALNPSGTAYFVAG